MAHQVVFQRGVIWQEQGGVRDHVSFVACMVTRTIHVQTDFPKEKARLDIARDPTALARKESPRARAWASLRIFTISVLCLSLVKFI